MKGFRGPLKKILAVLRSFSFLGVWAYALFAPTESYSNLTFSCLLILPALFHFLYTRLFASGSHSRRQTDTPADQVSFMMCGAGKAYCAHIYR